MEQISLSIIQTVNINEMLTEVQNMILFYCFQFYSKNLIEKINDVLTQQNKTCENKFQTAKDTNYKNKVITPHDQKQGE